MRDPLLITLEVAFWVLAVVYVALWIRYGLSWALDAWDDRLDREIGKYEGPCECADCRARRAG